MDEFEEQTYSRHEGYTYGSGYPEGLNDPSGVKESPGAKPDLKEDEQLMTVAGTLDPYRFYEIDLLSRAFSAPDDTYSTHRVGYSDTPLTVLYSDPRRVSIYPLGSISCPPGVRESDWKRMDMDGLFPYVSEEEPDAGVQREGDEVSTRVTETGGSSGGRGKPPEEEDKEEHDPTEMPFLDHLEEFRWALLKSIFAVVTGMLISWFLSDMFYSTMTRLAKNAELPLVYTKLLEPIMMKLQMAFFMGILLSLPFVFYFIWSFIAPGLYKNEKRWILPLALGATVCFFIGASVAYFVVIPFVLPFVKKFAFSDIKPMITISDFIGKLIKFTILFGVMFELPLVTYVLAKIGIVKHQWMAKYRKYAIVLIFVIGAVLTPPDPLSQIIMALPLILLYEISIQVARIAGRKTIL